MSSLCVTVDPVSSSSSNDVATTKQMSLHTITIRNEAWVREYMEESNISPTDLPETQLSTNVRVMCPAQDDETGNSLDAFFNATVDPENYTVSAIIPLDDAKVSLLPLWVVYLPNVIPHETAEGTRIMYTAYYFTDRYSTLINDSLGGVDIQAVTEPTQVVALLRTLQEHADAAVGDSTLPPFPWCPDDGTPATKHTCPNASATWNFPLNGTSPASVPLTLGGRIGELSEFTAFPLPESWSSRHEMACLMGKNGRHFKRITTMAQVDHVYWNKGTNMIEIFGPRENLPVAKNLLIQHFEHIAMKTLSPMTHHY